MRSQWNNNEDAALQGLTPEAQIIYLRGFRRYVDYATGVAGGHKRKLSYKALAELIDVDPDWGSKRERGSGSSLGRVRARVAELQRAGLVVNHGSCRALGLVFLLPLAGLGLVRREKEQHQNDPKEQHKEQHVNNVVKLPESKEIQPPETPRNDTGNNIAKTPRNDTHLYNYTLLNSNDAGAREIEAFPDTCKPKAPSDWGSFLGRERNWAFHRVSRPKLIILYQYWTQLGLSIGDIRLIMASAEANLGRIPDGPEYYRTFAETYALERDRHNHTQQQRGNHGPGTPDSQHRSKREERAAVQRQLTDPDYAMQNW